ncbi:MAG: AI-2E family transporter [Rhodothermales bacterium]
MNEGKHEPSEPREGAYEREHPSEFASSGEQLPSGFTVDRVIRVALGTGLVAAVAWLIWYFSSLVLFLVIGVVLAYLMRPLVDRLQGWGVARIPAIMATFVLVFGGLVVLITQLAPFATDQLRELSQQVNFQQAAQITAVDAQGPADAAGLDAGDAIVAVDGQPWDGFSQLQSILHAKQAGDSLQVEAETQGGDRVRRILILRDPDPSRGDQPVGDDERYVAALGVTARDVTLSNVAIAIERRIRTVLPIERGTIVNGVATGLNRIFGDDQVAAVAGSIVGLFTNIFYAVLVIPFVAFFFLKDGTQLRRSLLRLVPNRYFELTLSLIGKIETIVGRYFRALSFQVLAIAVVASTLLYVVGLQYAVAVGVFTGLANTIPYFGPLMGFVAGTLVGVVQTGDFTLVPGVILAMVLTQAADNVIFQPYIFSRAAQAHPLVILFAVLIGAQIAGIIGMLVAIPLMTIVRVAVQQVLWSLRNYRILKSA